MRVAWLRAGLCLAILGRAAAEEPPPAVKKVLALFDQLHQAELAERPAALLLRESDLNEYLSYSLREAPRPGLESVRVKIFPHNYVSTFAVVDFDAIEQWRPGAVPALLRPALRGKKTVWTDFRFRAQEGRLTFRIEKAYFQNLRLPPLLAEKLLELIAAQQPEGYDVSRPIPLPYGLRQVWTEPQRLHLLR